jgi:hypothetical protein
MLPGMKRSNNAQLKSALESNLHYFIDYVEQDSLDGWQLD